MNSGRSREQVTRKDVLVDISNVDDAAANPPSTTAKTLKELRAEKKGVRSAAPLSPSNQDEENAPFLDKTNIQQAEAPKETIGWGKWLRTKASNAASNAWNFVKESPLAFIGGVITSLTPAINAFTLPGSITPKQITLKWFTGLPWSVKVHSFANMIASASVNTVMGRRFLPAAFEDFKNSVVKKCTTFKEGFNNTSSIFLTVNALIAAAVISYFSYIWLPKGMLTSLLPTIPSTLITGVTSYIGIRKFLNRLWHRKDLQAQAEFGDALEHIKQEEEITLGVKTKTNYQMTVEAKFEEALEEVFNKLTKRDPNTALTRDEFNDVAETLSIKLTTLLQQYPNLLEDKGTAEKIMEYAFLVFDLTFAIGMVASPMWGTFSQKGYEGYNLLLGGRLTDIDGISIGPVYIDPIWLKRAIGTVPGLARAMFNFDAGLEFRQTLTDLLKHLKKHPSEIPFALVTIGANYLSSSGPQSVALSAIKVENKKNNILGIMPNRKYMLDLFGAQVSVVPSDIFVRLNQVGGFTTNFNSSVKDWVPRPTWLDLDLKKFASELKKRGGYQVSHAQADQFRLFLSTAKKQVEPKPNNTYDSSYTTAGEDAANISNSDFHNYTDDETYYPKRNTQ